MHLKHTQLKGFNLTGVYLWEKLPFNIIIFKLYTSDNEFN